jgi:hypothetical protein
MADAIDFKRRILGEIEWFHDHSQKLHPSAGPQDEMSDFKCCTADCRCNASSSTQRFPSIDIGRLAHRFPRDKVCSKMHLVL